MKNESKDDCRRGREMRVSTRAGGTALVPRASKIFGSKSINTLAVCTDMYSFTLKTSFIYYQKSTHLYDCQEKCVSLFVVGERRVFSARNATSSNNNNSSATHPWMKWARMNFLRAHTSNTLAYILAALPKILFLPSLIYYFTTMLRQRQFLAWKSLTKNLFPLPTYSHFTETLPC